MVEWYPWPMNDFMTLFLAARREIDDNASDSERGGERLSGAGLRMLGGTVEEMSDGRSGKERDRSIRPMDASDGPIWRLENVSLGSKASLLALVEAHRAWMTCLQERVRRGRLRRIVRRAEVMVGSEKLYYGNSKCMT